MKFEQKEELNAKELLILKCFSIGLLREEISEKLEIAPKTLRFYLHRIYKKLGVQKLHQAIVWYILKHYELGEKKATDVQSVAPTWVCD